jgi:hypothetical protein
MKNISTFVVLPFVLILLIIAGGCNTSKMAFNNSEGSQAREELSQTIPQIPEQEMTATNKSKLFSWPNQIKNLGRSFNGKHKKQASTDNVTPVEKGKWYQSSFLNKYTFGMIGSVAKSKSGGAAPKIGILGIIMIILLVGLLVALFGGSFTSTVTSLLWILVVIIVILLLLGLLGVIGNEK